MRRQSKTSTRFRFWCFVSVFLHCAIVAAIMAAPSTPLAGVWGTSGTDVFAVGYYGTIVHYGNH